MSSVNTRPRPLGVYPLPERVKLIQPKDAAIMPQRVGESKLNRSSFGNLKGVALKDYAVAYTLGAQVKIVNGPRARRPCFHRQKKNDCQEELMR